MGLVMFVVGILGIAIFYIGVQLGDPGPLPNITATNQRFEQCSDVCNQWDTRRQERCNAEARAKSLTDEVNRLMVLLAIAVAAAAAAFALAIAASATGIGVPVAIGLFIAAVAAAAAVDFLIGMLVSANHGADQSANIANAAWALEAEARAFLLEGCTGDEVNECLSRPSPC